LREDARHPGEADRPQTAHGDDFDYCVRPYFEEMENIVKELNRDMAAHTAGFRQRWDVTQVRIVTLDGADIGWLQSFVKDDALFLSQLLVDKSLRGQGIGTELVTRLIEEAASAGRAIILEGGEDKSRPAALRAARVSDHARRRTQVLHAPRLESAELDFFTRLLQALTMFIFGKDDAGVAVPCSERGLGSGMDFIGVQTMFRSG
jgi:GNAT superfamily N-acetyltransferase